MDAERYRLLAVTDLALHDGGTAAVMQWRGMLCGLAAQHGRQLSVRVLCPMAGPADAAGTQRLRCEEPGLSWLGAAAPEPLTLAAMEALEGLYWQQLAEFRPDAVLACGSSVLTCGMLHEARARGLPALLCRCGASAAEDACGAAELVLTASQAEARHCAQSMRLNAMAAGIFADPRAVADAEAGAGGGCVTLLRPTLPHGLAVWARLALMTRGLPEAPGFLVAQDPQVLARDLAALRVPGAAPAAALTLGDLGQVELVPPQTPLRALLERTRLLLMPSLQASCQGSEAAAAVFSSIPVLASHCGALPEACREDEGCGCCLEPPATCREDAAALPGEEEVRPWLMAMQRMLGPDHARHVRACAGVRDRAGHSAGQVWELLEPLLHRRCGSRARLLCGGSLRR